MWFELFLAALIIAIGFFTFGHFEERTPLWRRLLKLMIYLGITALLSWTAGRFWALIWVFGLPALGTVSTGGQAFQAGKPRALFEKEFLQFGPFPSYDLAPDGKRFVMFRTASTKEGGEASRTHLHFVFNWFEEVRRLAPAGKN